MRKIDRLFEIIQLLRGKRLRTAEFIANELGVSVRTIYRDIQGLIASGVPIEGERGVGYIIQQPVELPPLKFTPLELQALQLGIKLVTAIADKEISKAAYEASIKIMDALPQHTSTKSDPLAHVYFESDTHTKDTLLLLRDALNENKKIQLTYNDAEDHTSLRLIRPLALEYWGKVWTLTSWCELRDNFRAFRVDRITDCTITDEVFHNEAGKSYQDFLKQYETE